MEPGDLGLRPGLATHYLCDSKVKSANLVRLSFLLCKMEWLWVLPTCLRCRQEKLGRLSDSQGPHAQMISTPGQLDPQDPAADTPCPATLALVGGQQGSFCRAHWTPAGI